MGINGVGAYYAQNYATQNRSRAIGHNVSGLGGESIGNATSLSESSSNGKKIGITTVGNKGYIAMYADSSTEQDPVIKIGDYEVRVKEVNPNNATKMEMFALMSYLDDQGLTNDQGMKSFNKMTAYSAQAEYNGYCSGLSNENAAWTEKRDWIGILGNAKESFYNIPQTYEQGLECEKIIDNLKKYTGSSLNSNSDYLSQIHKKIEEMQEKLDNDEVNESFQIGGQTFTVEEWDEFLKKFDSIQEAMEALMKERHTKMEEQQTNTEEVIDATTTEMIVSESTSCTYPIGSSNGEDVLHITWYTEEGIFCRKAGQTEGYEWSIPFENKEQYNKVMEFIGQLPKDSDWRFASQEGFWKDFLDDEIDMSSFIDSIKNTNKKVASKEYSAEEIQEAIDREIQSNQHKKKSLYEMLINTCPEGTNATFRFVGESKIYNFYEFIEEFQRRSDEISLDSTSAISNTRRTEIKVSNFKEHETANYKFVPEPTIGKGGMRILKNGQSVAVFSADNLKIRVDEKTGTRVLISEIPGIGNSWYDALPVDVELENGLAEAIGVDDIPEVALDGYYIGTHAGTGIQYVMRPGDEGRGGKVLLKDAADVAKYNALAEEYFNRYPNLVTSPEYGRIYASFEICGMMERTPTGFVRIGFDNISYNDNLDYKKNWSAKITGETWDLLWKWLEENRSHMEDVGEFSTWGDIIDELGGSYERVWSDEELLQGYLNN
ncbi:MAG: hypothetical protein IJE49_11505 [Agathobacter sp.]|nr:hypothetical protein [Agathobacter sp.]